MQGLVPVIECQSAEDIISSASARFTRTTVRVVFPERSGHWFDDSSAQHVDVIQTQIGELVVGSYLRIINDCELVSYNQRSKKTDQQMELDVLGVESKDGSQTVYGCEVITHIDGMLYSGTPEKEGWWSEYGGPGYQYTLKRIWEKFCVDLDLLTDVFGGADEYEIQLWSPVVPNGILTDGLAELQKRFDEGYGTEIELVVNEEYTRRVDELRSRASETKKGFDEPAFRFFQILEHLREADQP